MSAVDWIINVLEKAIQNNDIKEKLENFINTAEEVKVPHDEEATKIKKISKLLIGHDEFNNIAKFTGDVFFEEALQNEDNFLLDEKKREKLLILNALKKLTKSVDSKPTPFYAMLIMDGDNMGALLSNYKNEQINISNALAFFNTKVNDIVEKNYGKLIYAGGDDVLCLLPVSTALECAKELKDAYIKAFKQEAINIFNNKEGTISAGIVYAHMNTALRAIIKDAHTLIDETAKKEIDRNAFAVRIWKRGGPILTFGKKWGKDSNDFVPKILELKESFKKKEISKGLIYKIIDLMPILEPIDNDKRKQLLVAEYLKTRGVSNSGTTDSEKKEIAEDRISKIMDIIQKDENKLSYDGLLLIKFLAEKEMI